MLLRRLLLNGTALSLPLFEGEGAGGAGGAGGTGGTGGAGGTPPAPLSAPWGSDPSAQWMLGEGGNAKPWYEALPDSPTKELYREKKYANPAVAADAHFGANRMVNGNAVELPNIEGDAKAWEPFNARMRGESVKAPTDYKFDFGKDKEGKPIEADPKMTAFAQQLAYDLGVHPKRAQELIVNKWQTFASEMNAKSVADANAANEAEANAVRAKWGANFETLRAGGERVAKSLKLDPTTLSAIESHIGAAPLMDLFAQLGKIGAEGKLLDGGGSGGTDPVNMTAEQVQQKINDKRADAQFMAGYSDRNHPNHANALKEMEDLHKLLAAKNRPA